MAAAGRTARGTTSRGPGGEEPPFSLRRETPLPLRRQIAVQLRGLLRAGRWAPGERLPGARRLAARLGVHRHTVRAAYLELARGGLVEVRPGSGAYARAGPRRPEAVFRRLLADARAAGLSTAALARRCDGWLEGLRGGAVALVAEAAPLRRLWRRELEAALGARGLRAELRELDPGAADGLDGPGPVGSSPAGPAGALPVGLVVTTFDLLGRLGSILPPAGELWAARGPARRRERYRLRRLPSGSVVVAASVSGALRREIVETAATLRGGEVAVRELASSRDPRLERCLPVADLVLADALLAPELEDRVEGGRLVRLRSLDPALVRRVAGWARAGADLRRSSTTDEPRRAGG